MGMDNTINNGAGIADGYGDHINEDTGGDNQLFGISGTIQFSGDGAGEADGYGDPDGLDQGQSYDIETDEGLADDGGGFCDGDGSRFCTGCG